ARARLAQIAGVEALARGHRAQVGADLGREPRAGIGAEEPAEASLHRALAVDVGRLEQGDAVGTGALDDLVLDGVAHRSITIAREAPGAERELGDGALAGERSGLHASLGSLPLRLEPSLRAISMR